MRKTDTLRLFPVEKMPHTLPSSGFVNFIGRESEINSVYRELEAISNRQLILQINGPAGIGKSALGLFLAHQLKQNFSDLQLSWDFDSGDCCETEASSPYILASFLRLFYLLYSIDYQPGDCLEENVFGYNRLMRDKKSIVFLDNVSHLEQINYLLPKNNGIVIITSRENLDLQGATSINLEPLSDNESQQLFLDIIGAEKAAESPKAVEEICKICNGYPEALVIAARTYTVKRHWRLANYRSQLLKTDAWLNWQNNQCRWSV